MRRIALVLSLVSAVSLVGCGGSAAGGAAAPKKGAITAEVNAARAEAEAQEQKLSQLRQEKAELEAQIEGKSAPAAPAAQ